MNPRELLKLLLDNAGENPNSLSKKTKVPQATIHRFLTGEAQEPRRSTLEPLAKYFGISTEALFDSREAAKVAAGLKAGPKIDLARAVGLAAGPDMEGKLPLISWVKAGELCESPDNFQPGDAEDWFDCPVHHSPNAYCLRIVGDSMDDGTAEGYRDGEIIFVDPAVQAMPGRDVIVRAPDAKTTFKRLKEDTEGLYLLGLNGKKIIRVPPGTVFCGVVIFSGVRRG